MEENLVNDSWDDIDLSDLTDEGDVSEETETPAEEPVEESESTEEMEADQPTDTEVRSEDTFTLKVLGEEKSFTREEVVPLAQKGMDYDRVKGQLEEARNSLKEYEQIKGDLSKRNEQLYCLEELAKEQNQTLDELIEVTQAQVMSRKTGQNIEVCRGIVKNQRLERELKAQQAKMNETVDQNAKRDADIDAFMKAYPNLAADPKALPQEVWDAVKGGESLLNAYRAYEIKELRAQLEQQKAEAEKKLQKEINKSRSTGSMGTKGKKTEDDFFNSLWAD
jgi:hypothetical protein